jgi:hypothetical protein
MSWNINKQSARFTNLSVSAQQTWDRFQNEVHRGSHPKKAAKDAGDTDFKKIGTTKNAQFQIRLSYCDRATFTVDEVNRVVTVLQVGGHT